MQRERAAPSAPLPFASRRLDWRFVLPRPADGVFDHLVLLGGWNYLPGDLLRIGLARRVSSELPAPRTADALVLLHDAPVTLEHAMACLRPGGVVYVEARPSARGWIIWRRLRRLGLTNVVPYWVRPHFDHATMHMPLLQPNILRWYVRTMVVASTPLQRIAAAFVCCLPLPVDVLLEGFVACRAYVGRVPTAPVAALPDVPMASPLVPDGSVPFVLAGGQTELKRVVLFPFRKGSTRPSAVLKVARQAEFNNDAVTEQAVLTRVRARLSDEMRWTVPQPLALLRDGPFVVHAESYSDGRTLSATSGQAWTPTRAKHRDMERVGAWLARFHQETTVERIAWDAAARRRFIEEPLAQYERAFGMTANEQRLFDAVRRRAESLDGLTLPMVWQHHNFGEWNVVRTRRGISVIDWEHARVGLPLCDLVHFALYWTLTVRRLHTPVAQEQGFRDLFSIPEPPDRTVVVARRAMTEYLAQLAIDRRFAPLLLLYTWVEKALHSGTIEGRRWNRSVGYVELLARHGLVGAR